MTEYTRALEYHCTTAVKWRRILAWLTDWLSIGAIEFALVSTLMHFYRSSGNVVFFFLMFAAWPLMFIYMIFGDVLLGRSLGKRIFGLTVVTTDTALPAPSKKKSLRGLLFLIFEVDFFMLLFAERTLSELITRTAVVRIRDNQRPPLNEPPARKGFRKWMLIPIIGIPAALFLSLMVYITLSVQKITKQSEQYRVAVDYVLSSERLAGSDATEEDVYLSAASHTPFHDCDGKQVYADEFELWVKGKRFKVICHSNDGKNDWYICHECRSIK